MFHVCLCDKAGLNLKELIIEQKFVQIHTQHPKTSSYSIYSYFDFS